MPDLANSTPIDPRDPAHEGWLRKLQGNILKGHGREHTINIFVKLPASAPAARGVVSQLSSRITSAFRQETERLQYKHSRIPGRLFCNLFLSANGYRTLGFSDEALEAAFPDEDETIRQTQSNFLEGMLAHAEADLGDPAPATWDDGFQQGDVDLMILLADDDADHLGREARSLLDSLEGRCEVRHIERGTALRNAQNEGIEHFGYVDGRSQPLFLTTDFSGLANGGFGPDTRDSEGGKIDVWNPFEPLGLVLIEDPLQQDAEALGSFFVFRKLEQNVRDFTIEEQRLADVLKLHDEERERAGAMTVGRFRDGTPVALSQTDGFVPPKENNFRYDRNDSDGLKCPFHAHIRKTNPRGDIITTFGATEEDERKRRIARRGITFGERIKHPNAFQALDDLPAKGVGLLFMCFQANIRQQFAFLQRGWANNPGFVKPPGMPSGPTGLDPIIGQRDQQSGGPTPQVPQQWRPEYGSPTSPVLQTTFEGFVRMKGGEFFFAPSIPFLEGLAPQGEQT